MNKLDRRSFLKRSALTTASLGLLPVFGADDAAPAKASAPANARVVGANDDIRYAVVGFNGRGGNHLSEMSKVKGCRLVALCDVDSKVLGREVAKAKSGEKIEGYTDIRK